MGRRAALPVLAVALILGAPAAASTPANPATRPMVTRSWPVDQLLSRISPVGDEVWARSAPAGIAFGDSVLRVAHATGDRTLQAAAHAWRGRKYASVHRLPEGIPDIDTAWALSVALRDSGGMCRAMFARGHGLVVMGKYEESAAVFRKLVPLARASGMPIVEGFAHRGIGAADKMAGRYDSARRHLEAAIRILPTERFEYRHSRFLLAEVKNRTGAHDEARQDFLALLDEARARNDRWIEAATLNDLGILEYGEGDMAQADRWWAYAAGVFDSSDDHPSAVDAQINRAFALSHLERTDEARTLIESLLAQANPAQDLETYLALLTELGSLDARTGRPDEAERRLRAVRAAEVNDIEENLAASSALAALLRDAGRARESEALLDSMLAPSIVARMTPDMHADALVQRSRTRAALERPADALADARLAEQRARVGRTNGSIYWLDAAIALGTCERAAGHPDSAVAVLREAARSWERWRSGISDLQWREREGSGLAHLFAEYGLALLDPRRHVPAGRRTVEAFDALQAFQARTLEERMHGRGLAGVAMRGRVGADSLRRGVLREGEWLVDLVATPDTTIAFVVTRAGLSAHLLPGTDRLDRLMSDWRDVALTGGDAAVTQRGLERLSAEVLAPLAPALHSARRVIVTGGGSLALWPWSALVVPGEREPLAAARELVTAPSATMFAALRRRAATGSAAGLLAVGRTTDAAGRDLPGARRELDALGARFTGVEVRANRGDRRVDQLTGDLPRWSVLHFAAHAEAEAGTPWRSGFLLGAGTGEDAYLRASRVATYRLGAELSVLSGCRSAGASTLAGEGALGLAGAFLCSGSRSVVATLWPVEDRVAERFMAEFYAALGRGRTVAGAVGDAQKALRARPETAEVRDWAAFVATGEGATHVRLTPRGSAAGRS